MPTRGLRLRKSGLFPQETLLLFGTAFLFHGLLIPWLGFYWDDWTPLLAAHVPSSSWHTFVAAFWENRPVSGFLLWLGMKLLGPHPWAWQGIEVLLRGLFGWQITRLLVQIWPDRPRWAFWVGFFAILYPGFRLHPVAVAFTPHWISLNLMIFSLHATWHGWRHPSPIRRWLWWLLSWISLAGSLLLLEYVIGLEAARWALLAWGMWTMPQSRKRIWAYLVPYVVVLLLTLGLVRAWSRPPEFSLSALIRLPGYPFHSLFYIALKGWWSDAVWDLLNWKSRRLFLIMALAGLGGVLVTALLISRRSLKEQLVERPLSPPSRTSWSAWLLLAVGLILAALVPLWANGRFVASLYSDRFLLPALLGMALLFGTLFVALDCGPGVKWTLLALMMAVSGQTLGLNGWTYVHSWQQARQVYTQLWWRAPSIQPNTPLVSEGALALYLADYVASESFNVLYRDVLPGEGRLAVWYYTATALPRPDTPLSSVPITHEHKAWVFQGDLAHSVVFVFRRAQKGKQCVWVLGSHDVHNQFLPAEIRPYVSYADESRILREPVSTPPGFFHLPVRADDWCYFFEKADLARQYGDWETVTQLWQQAEAQGIQARHIYEYRPFILAFGYQEAWDQAAALSLRAWTERARGDDLDAIRTYLCETWEKLLTDTPASEAREAAWREVQQATELECR